MRPTVEKQAPTRTVISFLLILAVFLASFLFPASSSAAPQKPAITDTQNLLGSESSRVQESVDSLQKETGVTLNLLFVSTFGLKKLDKTTIGKWVRARLDFTHPAKNTLLLAVASQDGQMALAVSHGSDQWLSSQVDTRFSDAAARPLSRRDPDWPGSVLALVQSVREAKAEHDSLPWKIALSIVIALLAIGLVVGVVFLVRRMRSAGFFSSHKGRHALEKPHRNSHHFHTRRHRKTGRPVQ